MIISPQNVYGYSPIKYGQFIPVVHPRKALVCVDEFLMMNQHNRPARARINDPDDVNQVVNIFLLVRAVIRCPPHVSVFSARLCVSISRCWTCKFRRKRFSNQGSIHDFDGL